MRVPCGMPRAQPCSPGGCVSACGCGYAGAGHRRVVPPHVHRVSSVAGSMQTAASGALPSAIVRLAKVLSQPRRPALPGSAAPIASSIDASVKAGLPTRCRQSQGRAHTGSAPSGAAHLPAHATDANPVPLMHRSSDSGRISPQRRAATAAAATLTSRLVTPQTPTRHHRRRFSPCPMHAPPTLSRPPTRRRRRRRRGCVRVHRLLCPRCHDRRASC
mmetsp:Transcript_38152/g.113023  ORF Transcript_38152/g.113023 Transcript_38152/m.113023 type:complete len:217 (-) Transcript_38152:609-1259(-)